MFLLATGEPGTFPHVIGDRSKDSCTFLAFVGDIVSAFCCGTNRLQRVAKEELGN